MRNVQIPVPDPPLRDDAVVLRPWSLDDVPAVTAACQDPEIPRWTTVPTPYAEEDARLWLESVTNPETEDRLGLTVTRAEDGMCPTKLEFSVSQRVYKCALFKRTFQFSPIIRPISLFKFPN